MHIRFGASSCTGLAPIAATPPAPQGSSRAKTRAIATTGSVTDQASQPNPLAVFRPGGPLAREPGQGCQGLRSNRAERGLALRVLTRRLDSLSLAGTLPSLTRSAPQRGCWGVPPNSPDVAWQPRQQRGQPLAAVSVAVQRAKKQAQQQAQ